MGHDPPAYRVWVKIVGLPLQAWTQSEIAHFIQHFGHPLEILPFGQQAGHYKDITTLVAANNLSHIPLAYLYREGDYSTRVDVHILASRPWEEGYFLPPGNHPSPDNSQTQSRRSSDWTQRGHYSSRFSSSNPPSEPTVDLSAWSPRSFQLAPLAASDETQRLSRHIRPQLQAESSTISLLSTTTSLFCFRLLLHGLDLTAATNNPDLISVANQIFPKICLDLLSVPSPVSLKLPSPPTQTIHACTFEATLRRATLPRGKTTSNPSSVYPLQQRENPNISNLADDVHLISRNSLETLEYYNEYRATGPLRPIEATTCKRISLSLRAHMLRAHMLLLTLAPSRAHLAELPLAPSQGHHSLTQTFNPSDSLPILVFAEQLIPLSTMDCLMDPQDLLMDPQSENPLTHFLSEERAHVMPEKSEPHLSSALSHSQLVTAPFPHTIATPCPRSHIAALPPPSAATTAYHTLNDTTSFSAPSAATLSIAPHAAVLSPGFANTTLSPDSVDTTFSLVPTAAATLPSPISQISLPKSQGKQLVVRRSQRLQTKKKPCYAPQKPASAAKNKMPKLPFDSHSQETPIGPEAALQILQASGLTITKRIEDLIQQAIKRDCPDSFPEDPRPSTPVHSVIPPRAMPDCDMLL